MALSGLHSTGVKRPRTTASTSAFRVSHALLLKPCIMLPHPLWRVVKKHDVNTVVTACGPRATKIKQVRSFRWNVSVAPLTLLPATSTPSTHISIVQRVPAAVSSAIFSILPQQRRQLFLCACCPPQRPPKPISPPRHDRNDEYESQNPTGSAPSLQTSNSN